MGFKFVALNTDTCIFKAIPEGDDNQDILLCVQSALKALQLNIVIDVSQKPLALEAVIPVVRSLQRVMMNHSKSLKIKGLDDTIAPESLAMLGELKVQLEFAVPPHDAANYTFKSLHFSLAQKIKVRRDLLAEKLFYQERLKVLRGGNQVPSEVQDGIAGRLQKIGISERQLLSLIDEKHVLDKKLEDMEVKLKEMESQTSADAKNIQEEFKKKREPLDKKIADLQKKLVQATKDFEKRSETRKAQLASLVKPAKP